MDVAPDAVDLRVHPAHLHPSIRIKRIAATERRGRGIACHAPYSREQRLVVR
jgi:hypothetical protein